MLSLCCTPTTSYPKIQSSGRRITFKGEIFHVFGLHANCDSGNSFDIRGFHIYDPVGDERSRDLSVALESPR